MKWWNNGIMEYWKIVFLSIIAATALAGEPTITCEPRELRGLPGEPLQVELTIETDRAAPIQLRIPAVSNLIVRTVEKIPIQRTPEGRYVQKRIVIWQGLEAGSTTLTNLTVSFQGLEPTAAGLAKKVQPLEERCPSLEITIDAVTPAEPPPPKEAE